MEPITFRQTNGLATWIHTDYQLENTTTHATVRVVGTHDGHPTYGNESGHQIAVQLAGDFVGQYTYCRDVKEAKEALDKEIKAAENRLAKMKLIRKVLSRKNVKYIDLPSSKESE